MSDMGERMGRSEEILNSLREETRQQTTMLRDIWSTIHGEGDKPGIKGRLQSLEDSESRRVWLVRATFTGSLAAVIAAVFSLFRSH